MIWFAIYLINKLKLISLIMIKQYLMIISIIGIILLAGCPNPVEPPEQYVHAKIGANIYESITPLVSSTNGRTEVNVPGFDQKFGTVTVNLINSTTFKGYTFTKIGNTMIDVLVPAGTYDIFMETDEPSPFYPYTNFIPFRAESYGVNVTEGSYTVLTATVERALVLFYKTGLDTAPTIFDYSPVADPQFPATNFWTDTEFYYIYVQGTWSYRLSYIQGGVSSTFDRTFLPGKIYVYDINASSVTTTDLFTEIITNN